MNTENEIEEWRPVPGCSGIEASSLGRIRMADPRTGEVTIRSHQLDSNGYVRVYLPRLKGVPQKKIPIHRMVAMAFHGLPAPERNSVNHINGVKIDNRACNLEWCSCLENMRHAYRAGLMPSQKGGCNNNAKLTEVQAMKVLECRAAGMTLRQISASFGVSLVTVHDIATGKSWSHLPRPTALHNAA